MQWRAAVSNASPAAAESPAISSRWPPHGKQPVAGGDPLVVIESGEQAQPRLGSFDHGQGERAIQRRHRVRGEAVEQLVEEQDLGPVGVPGITGLVVDGCDRGLQLVRTRGPLLERLRD